MESKVETPDDDSEKYEEREKMGERPTIKYSRPGIPVGVCLSAVFKSHTHTCARRALKSVSIRT